MKLHAYLSTSRHGIFYFRWPIPTPGRSTKRQTVRISLGTRCPKEAGALARLLAVCGEAADHNIRMSSMNHAELRAAVMEYFRAELKKGKDRRNGSGRFTDAQKESSETVLDLLEQGNAVYWKTMGREFASEELDRFFEASGLSREGYADCTPQVLDEIRRGRIGAFREALNYGRSLESYDFSEAQGAPLRASEPLADHPVPVVLGEAVRAFFEDHEKTGAWTEGTLQKRRAALGLAVEWFGPETAMSDIGKREATELKAALISLPSNRSKHSALEGLTLREAVAVTGVPTVTGSTANGYLSAFKVFWLWAETHGYASEVLFDGMKVGKKAGAVKDRRPFSQEALEKTYAVNRPGFTGEFLVQ